MLDLLKNPDILKLLAAAGGCGGILGLLTRYLVKPYGKVVDGDVSRLERDYQRKLAAAKVAHDNADPSDDKAADEAAELALDAKHAKERLRDFLSGLPGE